MKNTKFIGRYWFYLEYYTYIKTTKSEAIMLNTIDNSYILSKDERIIFLIEKIEETKMQGGLMIDFENDYKDKIYHSFFNKIRNKYMGDIISDKLFNNPPFQFQYKPFINNTYSTNRNQDYLNNLVFSINIHVTNLCTSNCKLCNKYYKQFYSCTKYLEGDYISEKSLENIFSNSYTNLNNINILGGNLSLYTNIDLLFKYLEGYNNICHAYFNIENINSITPQIISFFKEKIHLIIDFSKISTYSLDKIHKHLKSFIIDFIITDENSYNLAIECISLYKIERFTINPLFHNNISFFKKYIYINRKDILNKPQSIKKIHNNHLINPFYFGHLNVSPNGDVYGRIGERCLGNVNNKTITQIVYSILDQTDISWFNTRESTSCSSCVFTDICPPISNYEYEIGKFNLCSIKK